MHQDDDFIRVPRPGVINLFESLKYTYVTYFRDVWFCISFFFTYIFLKKDPENGFWFSWMISVVVGFLVFAITNLGWFKSYRERELNRLEMGVKIEAFEPEQENDK
jgi:hypothetical protein